MFDYINTYSVFSYTSNFLVEFGNERNYSSQYKGVSLVKQSGKHQAHISVKNHMYLLGSYMLAADAAWVVDTCVDKLGLPSNSFNFTSQAEYKAARKKEADERGLNLTRLETKEVATIVNNVIAAAGDFTPTTHSSLYKGVGLEKKDEKYHARICLKKKFRLGTYELASDAAWAYDECCRQLGLSPVNFACKPDYTNARKIALKERDLIVPFSKVQAYIASKVSYVVSNIETKDLPFVRPNNGLGDMWSCSKCTYLNANDVFKCQVCLSWRKIKSPKKSASSITKKRKLDHVAASDGDLIKSVHEGNVVSKELPPILSKNEYKPLFEVNDHVYAPWYSSGKSRAEQAWYPGVVKSYTTVKNGEYGPIRRYDIRFDDGDELDNIEDYCVFSRKDYLLSGKKDWIGVENIFDSRSKDPWAKKVGWYEVTIGESVSSRHFCVGHV